MARTLGDARRYYLTLLDEATKKGIALPANKNADYQDKFNYFIDSAQKYVAGLVKIPTMFQITQNPIPNLLGYMQGFDIFQYLPDKGDKVYTVTGCKSYYFEMDNVGTATIKVNGSVVVTINNTVKKQFTAYRGLVNAQSTDTVTFTFNGLYSYNIRNIGLFGYTFPLAADVPDYTPYVTYSMPTDFMSFDIPIIKSDPRVYEAYTAYKWENNKKIVLNYYDAGSFDIHYYKYPTDILPNADDSTLLEVEEKAFELVVLQTAINATASDNPALSSWLRSIFIERAQNITTLQMPTDNTVQTVYSIM